MGSKDKTGCLKSFFFMLVVCAPVFAGLPGDSPGRKYTSVERMSLERLAAVHRDVEILKTKRRPVRLQTGLKDIRAILHSHAEDSAHTGGTRAEMLDAAKKRDVKVIFLSDHYRPPRDFFTDSWHGVRDGVLFIPGAESRGFLVHPTSSILDKMELDVGPFIEAVTRNDGLNILSHVEKRPRHPMDGLTGMEIYNRHADAMDDRESMLALLEIMIDPEKIPEMEEALEKYPDELLAFQQDYQEIYIEKWDRETRKQRVVGIAANDCHHNQVYVVKMVDPETVLVGTIVDDDEKMKKITARMRPAIRELTRGHQPGDILVRFDLDPYDVFFHNVSTHLLVSHVHEKEVRRALKAGHVYVSHDWMCDPTGFVFGVMDSDGGERNNLAALMGDEVEFKKNLRLVAEFPVECSIRLIRNGEEVFRSESSGLDYRLEGPGVYRVEGWLNLDTEDRVWIYSNPVYLR